MYINSILIFLLIISRDVVGKFQLIFSYKFPDLDLRTDNETVTNGTVNNATVTIETITSEIVTNETATNETVTNETVTKLTDETTEAVTDVIKLAIGQSFNTRGKFRTDLPMFILTRNEAKSSIVYSPFSLIPPIAMLSYGNFTPEYDYQIEDNIGFKTNIIKTEIPRLWKFFRETHKMLIFMGMKMYVHENLHLNKKFVNFAATAFNIKPEIVDFNSLGFERTLNAWLKTQSGIQMRTIFTLKGQDDFTDMILLFAINMKGKWKHAFHSISYDNFMSTKGTMKIKMMHKTEVVKYAISGDLESKIISMPYSGSEVELVIVLPNNEKGLLNVLNQIKDTKSDILLNALNKLDLVLLNITIPEFKVKTEINLAPAIKNDLFFFYQKSGMPHIIKDAVYIDSALQSVFVKVTQKGTTSTSEKPLFKDDDVNPADSKDDFIANHPFLFFIIVKGDLFVSGIFTGDEKKSRIFDENYNDWDDNMNNHGDYD